MSKNGVTIGKRVRILVVCVNSESDKVWVIIWVIVIDVDGITV